MNANQTKFLNLNSSNWKNFLSFKCTTYEVCTQGLSDKCLLWDLCSSCMHACSQHSHNAVEIKKPIHPFNLVLLFSKENYFGKTNCCLEPICDGFAKLSPCLRRQLYGSERLWSQTPFIFSREAMNSGQKSHEFIES